MSKHLKNIIMDGLASTCVNFVSLPSSFTRYSKGVRYFRPVPGIDTIRGAMDDLKLGNQRRKHIIVRPSRFRKGLHELYTYHFPKTWSAACVANRELIKLAQRQAHALEHANTPEALEWKIRFFNHYFTVVKGGAKPEPGLKPYSRFYQYTYVAIYRQLKEQQRQTTSNDLQQSQTASNVQQSQTSNPISFDQIDLDPLQSFRTRRSPLRSAVRRAFLSSSFDEDFILKPRTCFTGV